MQKINLVDFLNLEGRETLGRKPKHPFRVGLESLKVSQGVIISYDEYPYKTNISSFLSALRKDGVGTFSMKTLTDGRVAIIRKA